MKVLFDQGTPVPLRHHLRSHEVTTDRNWKYQQNLSDRKLAFVVLLSTSWPRIQAKSSAVVMAVDEATAGSYVEVEI